MYVHTHLQCVCLEVGCLTEPIYKNGYINPNNSTGYVVMNQKINSLFKISNDKSHWELEPVGLSSVSMVPVLIKKKNVIFTFVD